MGTTSWLRAGKLVTRRMLGGLVLLVAAAVMVTSVGCASWWQSESDLIRRAVVEHQLNRSDLHFDDVIVRLSPGEFRADFGNDSRMVWLVSNALERRYREGEYFRVRDPDRSYIFVREIRYEESRDRAKVDVVLYAPATGAVTKEITVSRTAAGWEVTSQTPADSR